MERYYLVGDIGGTNLRMQLRNGKNEVIKQLKHKTNDYKSIYEFLDIFFQDTQVKPDQVSAAVCIASKIHDNVAVTHANFNWEDTNGHTVKEKFKFIDFQLLNDFEACGYSMPVLEKKLFILFNGHQTPNFEKDFKLLLVGPGTGLGVCLVQRRKGDTFVLPSEGGHIGLCAYDKEQYEFQEFAKNKFHLTNEIISAEWLFCGRAIPILYEFHCLKEGKEFDPNLKGEDVFGKIETDPISKIVFEHFLKILGTCLSHYAVAYLPDDGILISGTIIDSIKNLIQEDCKKEKSILLSSFINNVCSNAYLATVPIYFTPETDLQLKGCLSYIHLNEKNLE